MVRAHWSGVRDKGSLVSGQRSLVGVKGHWSESRVTGQKSLVKPFTDIRPYTNQDHWSMVEGHWSEVRGHWSLDSRSRVRDQWSRSRITGHRSGVKSQWSRVTVRDHWSEVRVTGQRSGSLVRVKSHWSKVTGQWSRVTGQTIFYHQTIYEADSTEGLEVIIF